MFLFDGKGGKKKEISLRGKSKTQAAKKNTVQEARAARAARAAQRSKQTAALRIQSVYRGYSVRKALKLKLREQFLKGREQRNENQGTTPSLDEMCSWMCQFYSPERDSEPMEYLCTEVLENWPKLLAERKDAQVLLLSKKLMFTIIKGPLAQKRLLVLLTFSNVEILGQKDIVSQLCERGLLSLLANQHFNGTDAPLASKMMHRVLNQSNAETFLKLALETLTLPINSDNVRDLHEKIKQDLQLSRMLIKSIDRFKDQAPWSLTTTQTCTLLASMGNGARNHIRDFDGEDIAAYCNVIYALGKVVPNHLWLLGQGKEKEDKIGGSDDESDDNDQSQFVQMDMMQDAAHLKNLLMPLFDPVNLAHIAKSSKPRGAEEMVGYVYLLVRNVFRRESKIGILNILSNETWFLTSLWRHLDTKEQRATLENVKSGILSHKPQLVASLRIFCDVYSHSLLTLDDENFYEGTQGGLSLPEVIALSSVLKNVSVELFMTSGSYETIEFDELRMSLSKLLRQLFLLNTQREYCPSEHWLATSVCDSINSGVLRGLSTEAFLEADDTQLGLSSSNMIGKLVRILKAIPFVVPFDDRAFVLQSLNEYDKRTREPELANLFAMGNRFFEIRRTNLYEDAFDKLNDLKSGLRSRIRVQMINESGLPEAGVDGGGVFREFLSSVIKHGFDPNAGLFRESPDHRLYPNPQAMLANENAWQHFQFLGRMLGKAIYDGMLVELPLARFFLTKVLGRFPYLNDLKTLDAELHKNLMFVKNYDGDVSELELDFSVGDDGLASGTVHDLVPGGRDIAVTNANKIKYVYYMADFKLNKQIERQCRAFRRGLFDVVNKEWLVMFSPVELQQIISGADVPIDMADLRKHTVYGNGYHNEHETIEMFWKVVGSFDNKQRQNLLRFVTSCRLPPLLGFAHLVPNFGIAVGGGETERLPTASTCMNLLKLPQYTDEKTLRDKLLYAISSESGFELS
eukprot:m.193938 g.193938  ORF g.193938 m.193938 type:complete len:971 (-) comp15670_c0_seq3:1826-4738(-)